jgi:hypothetical protein
MVHGYLYYHSNHLSKLKCELNLPQTSPPTHAHTRMATLAFLHSNKWWLWHFAILLTRSNHTRLVKGPVVLQRFHCIWRWAVWCQPPSSGVSKLDASWGGRPLEPWGFPMSLSYQPLDHEWFWQMGHTLGFNTSIRTCHTFQIILEMVWKLEKKTPHHVNPKE